MNADAHDSSRFTSLPPAARTYVVLITLAGVAALAAEALNVRLDHPGLFSLLLALAIVTSTVKVVLPLGRSQSNLSLSHAINFWALLALGPAEAVCIGRAVNQAGVRPGVAAQFSVERPELPGWRRACRNRHGGVGTRLDWLAGAAGGAAVSGLPQLSLGGHASARRTGPDAPRDGSAACDNRGARAGH